MRRLALVASAASRAAMRERTGETGGGSARCRAAGVRVARAPGGRAARAESTCSGSATGAATRRGCTLGWSRRTDAGDARGDGGGHGARSRIGPARDRSPSGFLPPISGWPASAPIRCSPACVTVRCSLAGSRRSPARCYTHRPKGAVVAVARRGLELDPDTVLAWEYAVGAGGMLCIGIDPWPASRAARDAEVVLANALVGDAIPASRPAVQSTHWPRADDMPSARRGRCATRGDARRRAGGRLAARLLPALDRTPAAEWMHAGRRLIIRSRASGAAGGVGTAVPGHARGRGPRRDHLRARTDRGR